MINNCMKNLNFNNIFNRKEIRFNIDFDIFKNKKLDLLKTFKKYDKIIKIKNNYK